MQILLKLIVTTTLALHLCACSAKSAETPSTAKQYYDMSEEKQVETLNVLIRLFDQAEASKRGNQNLSVVYEADASQDIIRAFGTYKKVVSAKDLVTVKKLVAKIQAEVNPCDRPEFRALSEYGIGFQAVMIDLKETVLYESEICRGAV